MKEIFESSIDQWRHTMENKTANDPRAWTRSQVATADTERQAASAGSAESLTDDLFKELTVLGSRFVEVVQSAWNSEERKQIQDDLKEGISSVASEPGIGIPEGGGQ